MQRKIASLLIVLFFSMLAAWGQALEAENGNNGPVQKTLLVNAI